MLTKHQDARNVYWQTEPFDSICFSIGKELKKNFSIQHGGVIVHITNTTPALLQELFGDRIVKRGLQPPLPPDLTPPEFYEDF
jgi:hypothetical protein